MVIKMTDLQLNLVSNNPLAGPDCGDKKLSNKVMGFTVDFGIPNQNMFESITLDQEQFQNTSESYKNITTNGRLWWGWFYKYGIIITL